MKQVCSLVAMLLLLSCTNITAKEPSQSKVKLDIWLVDSCPSLSAQPERSLFVSALIGGVIDFVVDGVSSAISKAAKADKEGMATKGNSAGYIFKLQKNENGNMDYKLPSCAVVAIADSSPNSWCGHEPFKSADFCKPSTVEGKKLLSEYLVNSLAKEKSGSGLPLFYAEIMLFPSSDKTAALPRLYSLYYPEGLHNSKKFKGDKNRDVSIKVEAFSPEGKQSINTIHLILSSIKPENKLIIKHENKNHKIFRNEISNQWIAISAAPKKLPELAEGTYFGPVNLSSEIREVGKPSAFLQALAKFIDENKDELADELKNRYVPSRKNEIAKTEELSTLESEQKVSLALSNVFKYDEELTNACKSATNDEPNNGKNTIKSKWQLSKAYRKTFTKLQIELESDSSFGDELPDYDASKSALDNCRTLKI